MLGVLLLMQHPDIAQRDCEECRQFVFDERTNKKQYYHGNAVRRPPGSVPSCHFNRCPKGHYDSPNSLRHHNYLAYVHYLECKAIGQFPNDPVVRRNAAIIRMVEESVEKADRHQQSLIEAFKTIKAKNG